MKMSKLFGLKSVEFNGTSNVLTFSNSTDWIVANDIIFAIKFLPYFTNQGVLLEKENEYIIKMENDEICFGVYNGVDYTCTTLSLNRNDWNTIVCGIHNTTIFIYVNEMENYNLEGILTIPSTTTNALKLGYLYDGMIDDIKKYSLHLDTTRIESLLDDEFISLGLDKWINFENSLDGDDKYYDMDDIEYFTGNVILRDGKEYSLYKDTKFLAKKNIW